MIRALTLATDHAVSFVNGEPRRCGAAPVSRVPNALSARKRAAFHLLLPGGRRVHATSGQPAGQA